jgi:hypothetical protein
LQEWIFVEVGIPGAWVFLLVSGGSFFRVVERSTQEFPEACNIQIVDILIDCHLSLSVLREGAGRRLSSLLSMHLLADGEQVPTFT